MFKDTQPWQYPTLFLMPISPLLPVLGFLTGRTRTVGTGDIFLFLGFGLYLIILLTRTTSTTK